jgi:hypothetical protein
LHAELGLEGTYLGAERRLRDVQAAGRLGKIQGFRDSYKIAQVAEFHPAILGAYRGGRKVVLAGVRWRG